MVSIVMPAYNAEKFIVESIESVLAQSYLNWELWIIDDCSSDATATLSLEYTYNFEQIHYHLNERNLGTGLSRNVGITLANGEWIAFLDSDDLWRKDKLELQLACADVTGGDFLFSGSSFIDEMGISNSYNLQVPATISYHELLKQNLISCSSVLIKRDLILSYPMEALPGLHEDFVTWLQILKKSTTVAYGVQEPLLIYRVYSSSKSGNKLKAAKMTFRAYRYVGLGLLPSLYYWGWYAWRSVWKYRGIKG